MRMKRVEKNGEQENKDIQEGRNGVDMNLEHLKKKENQTKKSGRGSLSMRSVPLAVDCGTRLNYVVPLRHFQNTGFAGEYLAVSFSPEPALFALFLVSSVFLQSSSESCFRMQVLPHSMRLHNHFLSHIALSLFYFFFSMTA